MKKLLVLTLMCSLVLAFVTPVSAGCYWYKDVSANDFTNALVDYCNHNEVHNMTESEFELSGHDFRSYNVTRTDTTLDFYFESNKTYFAFELSAKEIIPILTPYEFGGHMHVDYPEQGLGRLYRLFIRDNDCNFTAHGSNWNMTVENGGNTRFNGTDDDSNCAWFSHWPVSL